ncbi:hypothetical protein N9N28_12730 [Rubripirellula amarantea]|nr:hypothetical protein [Rubripirellula amarantea]
MSLTRRYPCSAVVRHVVLVTIITANIFALAAPSHGQDSQSSRDDQPTLGELVEDDMTLRDLMLDEFEAEANADDPQRPEPKRRNNRDRALESVDDEEDEVSASLSDIDEDNQRDSHSLDKPNRHTGSVDALRRLQRPLHEIAVTTTLDAETDGKRKFGSNSTSSVDTPASVAASLMNHSEPEWVMSTGSTFPIYSRQTIRFCHRPLYFEDPNLERCGKGWGCLQNPVSAVRFLGDALLLPYQMVRQRPQCEVSSLGDCRCGESYPHDRGIHHFCDGEFDGCATLAELAVISGFSFLLL